MELCLSGAFNFFFSFLSPKNRLQTFTNIRSRDEKINLIFGVWFDDVPLLRMIFFSFSLWHVAVHVALKKEEKMLTYTIPSS